MSKKWTDRDEMRTRGVDRRLYGVMKTAFESWDGVLVPTITEGLRTAERQAQLLAQGKSKTLNSKHLTGRAVDIALLTNDRKSVNWDIRNYRRFAEHVALVAEQAGVAIRWGGSWRWLTGDDQHDHPFVLAKFADGPHFEV